MLNFKNSARLSAVAIAAMLAVSVTAPSAQAAPKHFCKSYAKIAVKQNKRNFWNGCGFHGWRWHGFKKGHYSWCRNVPAWKATTERFKRESMLHNAC